MESSLPTLDELRQAPSNKSFFAPKFGGELFQGEVMSVEKILWQGRERIILRVTSEVGTEPLYEVDPETLALSYLTHAKR